MTYNTEKRSEITAFLKVSPNRAFSIDEIAAAVCPDGSARSTVYRIVSKMVGEGKLRKITDEHSRHTTYQYLGESGCCEHLHLKCKNCGSFDIKIVEYDDYDGNDEYCGSHYALRCKNCYKEEYIKGVCD